LTVRGFTSIEEEKMIRQILHAALIAAIAITLTACGGKGSTPKTTSSGKSDEMAAKVTFLELGSVTCIPCKKMQPIMKSIETRYAGQVKVIFYDVLKDRAPATQYRIKLIPTQIFLDQKGKEITRHVGFFPEEEIDKILKAQGLSPVY
jgi:thioredoxin 1